MGGLSYSCDVFQGAQNCGQNRFREFTGADNIPTTNNSFSSSFNNNTKWKVDVQPLNDKSGDLVGKLLPTRTEVITPDQGLNQSPEKANVTGTFVKNQYGSVDSLAASWYHDPLDLSRNFANGSTLPGICSATKYYLASSNSPVFSSSTFPGAIATDQIIGGAGGRIASRLFCNGDASTIAIGLQNPGTIPDLSNIVNDGRCDAGGNCIVGSAVGNPCSFLTAGVPPFYISPANSACGGCPSPFTRTLPVGYGSAVDGFLGVSPRSSAFSDYVSNSFFRDNYANESQTDFGQLFMGYYLARKIVDGECVTMLCPEDPNSDNYCKALRNCN